MPVAEFRRQGWEAFIAREGNSLQRAGISLVPGRGLTNAGVRKPLIVFGLP